MFMFIFLDGHWMAELSFYYNDQLILVLHIYFKVFENRAPLLGK